MVNDRRATLLAGHAALHAIVRVGPGELECAFADGHALQADAEARVVHHREHRREPLTLFADQVADSAVVVAEIHDAGRAAVNAELVLERCRTQVVALADRTVVVDQELRHQEHRDATHAFGSPLDTCEDEMNDVLGELVIAPGDVDLRAGNAEMVAVARRARLDRSQVGAGLRLGQEHRAGPLAGDELRQELLLESIGAVRGERDCGVPREHR